MLLITTFCDFRQKNRRKIGVFPKYIKHSVVIKFLNNLALFRVKNANFFDEYFKNQNIVPDCFASMNVRKKKS
jgi:hypothetical protein